MKSADGRNDYRGGGLVTGYRGGDSNILEESVGKSRASWEEEGRSVLETMVAVGFCEVLLMIRIFVSSYAGV
jgi:hypothetical protein